MDIGSSLIRLELIPDQMNRETHSRESDFPTRVPRTSDVTLTSFRREISYHPASFPEETEVVLPIEVESDVSIRIDAASFEELQMVIINFISQKEAEKLWCMVRGPSTSHHTGLVLAMLQTNPKLLFFFF